VWRSAETTSGTDSALAPERPQLKLSIHVYSTFMQAGSHEALHTDTTYAVTN